MQGTLTKVTPGTAKNGNKFIFMVMEDSLGAPYKYTTYNPALMSAAKALNGEDVMFEDEENEKNPDWPVLIMLKKADGNAPKPKGQAGKMYALPRNQAVVQESGDERDRRITELACMKVAGTVVAGMWDVITEVTPEDVMKAGNLVEMLTGKLVGYINRPEPVMQAAEEETPAPKPKKSKGKKTLFIATLIAADYDVNDKEQMEKVAVWLEDTYGCREFTDLTEESQDKAIAAMKENDGEE